MKTFFAILLLTLWAGTARAQGAPASDLVAATNLSLPPFHLRDQKLTLEENAAAISNAIVELEAWQRTNAVVLVRLIRDHTNHLDPVLVSAESTWAIGEHRKVTYRHFYRNLQMELKMPAPIPVPAPAGHTPPPPAKP